MTSFLNTITNKRKKTVDQIICSLRQSIIDASSTFSSLSTSSQNTPNPKEHSITSLSVASESSNISLPTNEDDQKQPMLQNLCKQFTEVKILLCGEIDHPQVDEEKIKDFSRQFQLQDFFFIALSHLMIIPLEGKKDLAVIYIFLLKKNSEKFQQYLESQIAKLLPLIVQGYEHPDLALICGQMLKESIKFPFFAKYLLIESPFLWPFFDSYVHLPNFDVAHDAFNVVKELFTNSLLQEIQQEFFDKFANIFIEKYQVSF
jgi:calcium binding protein 39